jgi:hypothetical protein
MRELEEQRRAQLAEEIAIEVAVERWLKSIRAEIENKYTRGSMRRRREGFCRGRDPRISVYSLN